MLILIFIFYLYNTRNIKKLYTMIKTGKTTIRFATALQTGNYHKTGIEIAKFQDEMNTKLHIELIRTKGSVENINLLKNKQIDFILVQEDIAKEFNHPDFRFVCALYDEMLTCITTRDSNVSKITDLNNDRYRNPDIPNYNTKLEFSNLPNREGIEDVRLIEKFTNSYLNCFQISSIAKRQNACEPYNKKMIIETFGDTPQYRISVNQPGSGSFFNSKVIIISMTRKVVQKEITDIIMQNITEDIIIDKNKIKNTILKITKNIRKDINKILTQDLMENMVKGVVDKLQNIPNDIKDINTNITSKIMKQITNFENIEINSNKSIDSLDNIDDLIIIPQKTNTKTDLLSLPQSKLEKIELFCMTTSHPNDNIKKLSERIEIRFVDLDIKLPYERSGINMTEYPELLRQFQERKDPVAHNKKVYKPVKNDTLPDVDTYKTRCVLLTRKNINMDIVYILVKSIFVNNVFLRDLPFGRLLNPRHMSYTPINIKTHLGSIKYFNEIQFHSRQDIPISEVTEFKII